MDESRLDIEIVEIAEEKVEEIPCTSSQIEELPSSNVEEYIENKIKEFVNSNEMVYEFPTSLSIEQLGTWKISLKVKEADHLVLKIKNLQKSQQHRKSLKPYNLRKRN